MFGQASSGFYIAVVNQENQRFKISNFIPSKRMPEPKYRSIRIKDYCKDKEIEDLETQQSINVLFTSLNKQSNFALYPRCSGIVDSLKRLDRSTYIQESFQTVADATEMGYKIKLIRRWKAADISILGQKKQPFVFPYKEWNNQNTSSEEITFFIAKNNSRDVHQIHYMIKIVETCNIPISTRYCRYTE